MKRLLTLFLAITCIIAITGCSKSAQDYFSSAEKYMTAGEYQKAVEDYKNILKIDPKNVDAYSGLSKAYLMLGNTEEYINILQSELDNIQDSGTSVYVDLAVAYYDQGDKDQFTSLLTTALARGDAADAQMYIDVANAYKEKGMTEQYAVTLKNGYEKTTDEGIKKLLAEINSSGSKNKTAAIVKDIADVYDKVMNSGKVNKKPTIEEVQATNQYMYLLGFPKGKNLISIIYNEVGVETIDGKYTNINKEVDLSYSTSEYNDHKIYYASASIQMTSASSTDKADYYISYTQNDELELLNKYAIQYTRFLTENGVETNTWYSYYFIDDKFAGKDLTTSLPIDTIFDQSHFDLIVSTINDALAPFGMSIDNLFDKEQLFYYANQYK